MTPDVDFLSTWLTTLKWMLRLSYLALGLNVYLVYWNITEDRYIQAASSVVVVAVIGIPLRMLHFMNRSIERRRKDLYARLEPIIRKELTEQGASADSFDLAHAIVKDVLP